MKRIYQLLFLITLSVLVYSCGSSKSTGVSGDVELNLPCQGLEYNTNKDFFRANMPALSTDMGTAKSKALIAARAEVATSVNALVERVTDNYNSSYQSGEQEEAKIRTTDMIRSVVKENLRDSRIICEKIMKTKDGKYRCYVAVEVSKNDILNEINSQLRNDEKLRMDFEYEKFKKIFEEEMNKLDK